MLLVPQPGHLSNAEQKLPKWAWKQTYMLKVWKHCESQGLRQELELDVWTKVARIRWQGYWQEMTHHSHSPRRAF
jgi:hypothetical protein